MVTCIRAVSVLLLQGNNFCRELRDQITRDHIKRWRSKTRKDYHKFYYIPWRKRHGKSSFRPNMIYVVLISTLLLWIWKAGVIQLPQLHWMPDQLKYPKRASQWMQDNFPSKAPSLTVARTKILEDIKLLKQQKIKFVSYYLKYLTRQQNFKRRILSIHDCFLSSSIQLAEL